MARLIDDPFRSLAGELRRAGGFAKDTTPFSEFLWADFLRRRVKRKTVEARFEHALEQALELAKNEEAGREAMLREVGQYAVAVVGLSAAVNFGLVIVLADYDPTLFKIVAVAAAAVPAALVAWFVSTRVLHIGTPG